jgi:hypothetical protein
MRMRQFVTIAAVAFAVSLSASAQKAVPRTADGKPNLEGIWQASSTASADLQDHVASLNMAAGRSVIAGGGAIPYQTAAAAQRNANFADRLKADPLEQCYIPGVPRVMYLDFPFQIFQTPRAIAMAFEWSLDYRLILTDGSGHPNTFGVDSWMGDSRGKWDGDTLIVDTTGFNDKTNLDTVGHPHSDAMHIVERFTRTDDKHITYEITIEDSKAFTHSWKNARVFTLRPDWEVMEYSCEENNKDLSAGHIK